MHCRIKTNIALLQSDWMVKIMAPGEKPQQALLQSRVERVEQARPTLSRLFHLAQNPLLR
jgi:hypothetical protein